MRPLLFASVCAVSVLPACAPSTPDDSTNVEAPNGISAQDGSPTEDTASPSAESSNESDEKLTQRISVGDKAPGFRLPDQTGKQRTLDELLANGKVALVFYRSADW